MSNYKMVVLSITCGIVIDTYQVLTGMHDIGTYKTYVNSPVCRHVMYKHIDLLKLLEMAD